MRILGHGQLLEVVAIRSRVKVIHGHRYHRLARQHQPRAHAVARVRCTLGGSCRASAVDLSVDSRAVARAARREAGDRSGFAEQRVFARDAARRTRAREQDRHAQTHLGVACEVDLRKAAVAHYVERRVVWRVFGLIGELEIEVRRRAVGVEDGADVQVSDRRHSSEIGSAAAQVAVEQVGV